MDRKSQEVVSSQMVSQTNPIRLRTAPLIYRAHLLSIIRSSSLKRWNEAIDECLDEVAITIEDRVNLML